MTKKKLEDIFHEKNIMHVEIFDKIKNLHAKKFDVVISMTPRGAISYNIVI